MKPTASGWVTQKARRPNLAIVPFRTFFLENRDLQRTVVTFVGIRVRVTTRISVSWRIGPAALAAALGMLTLRRFRATRRRRVTAIGRGESPSRLGEPSPGDRDAGRSEATPGSRSPCRAAAMPPFSSGGSTAAVARHRRRLYSCKQSELHFALQLGSPGERPLL